MTVLAIHRPGQVNQAAGVEALWIPVAADRVLLSYESSHTFLTRAMVETVPPGAESVQFPMIGDADTVRREVGKSILLDAPTAGNETPSQAGGGAFVTGLNMGERRVFLDRPTVSAAFIDNFEAFSSTLENGGRAPVLEKLGYALGKDADIYGYRLIVKSSTDTTRSGGIDWSTTNLASEFVPPAAQNFIVDANAGTDGAALLDAIRSLTEQWDVDEVPDEGRHIALNPARYNLLVNNQDLLNRDFGGANGIFSDGTVFKAWGAELIKVKGSRLPTTDTNAEGTDGIRGTNYNIDATNVVAVGWQDESIAIAKAGEMSLMTEDLRFEYDGVGVAAQMGYGLECFRPLGVGAISTAA